MSDGPFWFAFREWGHPSSRKAGIMAELVASQIYKQPFRKRAGTYGHTHKKARDPVRSPLVKLVRARVVVGSVTTSECRVLYVFCSLFGFKYVLYSELRMAGMMCGCVGRLACC
jgi:hypothetical protein